MAGADVVVDAVEGVVGSRRRLHVPKAVMALDGTRVVDAAEAASVAAKAAVGAEAARCATEGRIADPAIG